MTTTSRNDMDEKSLFTDFWRKESETTRKVLERIPEGSTYKPDPKSRTAQEIAWQIVCEEKMIIDESFEIRDLVYSKKDIHKYWLV